MKLENKQGLTIIEFTPDMAQAVHLQPLDEGIGRA